MRSRFVVFAAVFASTVFACGDPEKEPVSRNFDGVWLGQALVEPVNVGEFSYEMILSSAVASETTVVFDSMCPDFSGQMIARGEGQSVSWSGALSCAPLATTLCEAVTMTFTEATFRLGDTGIHVEMRGTASGCEISDTPFALTYNGE